VGAKNGIWESERPGIQKWVGEPEVGGGARSGAEEPGLIEEPEVNREVDTATDQ